MVENRRRKGEKCVQKTSEDGTSEVVPQGHLPRFPRQIIQGSMRPCVSKNCVNFKVLCGYVDGGAVVILRA